MATSSFSLPSATACSRIGVRIGPGAIAFAVMP
jgi:hypothetical protein